MAFRGATISLSMVFELRTRDEKLASRTAAVVLREMLSFQR